MIDPIKRLRTCLLCEPGKGHVSYNYKSADALADEIEAAYMKLPVDADGVPIRTGDYMALGDSRGEVLALTYAREDPMPWQMQLDDDEWYSTEFAYHAKPDTVESLLQELADEVWNASCESQTTWSDSGLDGIAERYAERIREAVKTQANSLTKLEAENAELRREAKIAGVERERLLAKIRELSYRVVEGERMAITYKESAQDLVQEHDSINALAWDVAKVTHYTYDEALSMFDRELVDLIAAMLEECEEQEREMNDYDSVAHECDIPRGLR